MISFRNSLLMVSTSVQSRDPQTNTRSSPLTATIGTSAVFAGLVIRMCLLMNQDQIGHFRERGRVGQCRLQFAVAVADRPLIPPGRVQVMVVAKGQQRDD